METGRETRGTGKGTQNKQIGKGKENEKKIIIILIINRNI